MFTHSSPLFCFFIRMNFPLKILFCVGLLHQGTTAVFMGKLADNVLSMATALDDFIAPDCRFINIKKGQMVYVYSKLIPPDGTGVFWSGSVYSEQYVDQMGRIGYFPSPVVKETHKFTENTIQMPTTDMDFYCD
ncbi:otoraplin isoform X2 [Nothobranchius furzeri]|uniref:Transcript variant X2 n=1 Tax=Nothobranchius furzeri TaxID=105023 RepID=A0A9D3BVV5_NOTFU|nr:otoraplin isoform X2 [Nothobranchius furzeri]KAF7220433.1 transcript variant X2 [Nothobranchius furzeri]